MSKLRKFLIIFLTVCCVALIGAAAACSGDNIVYWREPEGGVVDDGSVDPNNPNGSKAFYYPEGVDPDFYADRENRYVINTVSMGGLPLDGVRVTVAKGSETVIEGISQNGTVEFGIPFDDYDLYYDNLPEGYSEDSEGTAYHLTADTTHVVTRFSSYVLPTTAPSGMLYQLGQVMYNFSATSYDGKTLRLYDVLQQKKVVVLNFWASWCGPCRQEMPALNEAYNNYKDDVEVFALTTETSDTDKVISNIVNGYTPALSFFTARDDQKLYNHFSTSTEVPISIIIDRYGVVAYYEVGGIPNVAKWETLFAQYAADDYTQQLVESNEGETGSNESVAPPEFLEFDPIDDNAFNSAFLDGYVPGQGGLHYYGPEEGTDDALKNWPWKVAEDTYDGTYITPTNIGEYSISSETEEKFKTDNTFSMIMTDIVLEAGQTLIVDIRYNTEDDADYLIIMINNSYDTYTAYSGDSNGWQSVELYKATYQIGLNISITYVKNSVAAPKNEFVGLKNLRVSQINENTDEALDILEEVTTWDRENDTATYKPVYLNESDGFYYVQVGTEKNQSRDSMLFTDILFETLWAQRHLAAYTLVNEGYELTKSLYNISFWEFGEVDSTIADNYYFQSATGTIVPVTEAVKEMLVNFTAKAAGANSNQSLEGYAGGYDPDYTWLELCQYYRQTGRGDHSAANHVCAAHTNPAAGHSTYYAIPFTIGTDEADYNHIDTTNATMLNRIEGVFYSLTAPQSGVYSIKSMRPYSEADEIDPKIVLWGEGEDVFYGTPLLEQDDTLTVDRFKSISYNFNAIIYLNAGETVYAQLSTRMTDTPGQYDVMVQYLGEKGHVLEIASVGEGLWIGENEADAVYDAINTTMGGPNGDTYYHLLDNGETGSMLYIDFLNANFYDRNENTLKDMVDRGAFDFTSLGGGNFTSRMKQIYGAAMEKDLSDPTYGMATATTELVNILSSFLQYNNGESIETGLWKAFAYYYHYYGPSTDYGWSDEIINLLA